MNWNISNSPHEEGIETNRTNVDVEDFVIFVWSALMRKG